MNIASSRKIVTGSISNNCVAADPRWCANRRTVKIMVAITTAALAGSNSSGCRSHRRVRPAGLCTIEDFQFDERPLRFHQTANLDRMHAKRARGLDVEQVVVEKKYLCGTAAQGLQHMLERLPVGFDAPGQVRDEVTVERGAEPHFIEHPRPVQGIAVGKQCA